jgi:hypothetical protein
MQMKTEVQGDVLYVTLSGQVDLDSSLRLLIQAFDTAAKERIAKVLIDALALTGNLSTLERYELGKKTTSHVLQLGTNPKVAFVGVLPAVDGFGVRVAQNSGVTVELFHRVQEASGWLAKWPAPPSLQGGD